MPQAVASSEEWETQVLRWSWDEKSPLVSHGESQGKCSGWAGVQSLTRATGSPGVCCLLFPLVSPFLVLGLPHSQPGLNPTGSVTVSCSPSMETWAWIQASQQILQQMVVLMPFPFTPLHSVTPTHAPLPCLLVPVTRVSFSFCLFLFSFPKSTHQETNRMIHSIAQILHSFIPSQTHSLVRFLPFLSYCLCLI